jgi:hypothetical protein
MAHAKAGMRLSDIPLAFPETETETPMKLTQPMINKLALPAGRMRSFLTMMSPASECA